MPRRRSGEPWEVIHVAAASLRLIGGILLLLGALGMLTLVLVLGFDDHFRAERLITRFFTNTVPYLLSGCAFLLVAYYVARRRPWAAAVALSLTSVACLIAFVLLVALVVLAQTADYASYWMAVPIIVVGAFAFALGRLIFHLTGTFWAIRQLDPARPRRGPLGFEPVTILPAPPLPPSQGGPHADPAQG